MIESIKGLVNELTIPPYFDGTLILKRYFDDPRPLSIFEKKHFGKEEAIDLKVISKEEFDSVIYLRLGVILSDEILLKTL